MTAQLPEVVRAVRKGDRFSLLFDGQHFPWLVDLVETVMSGDRAPTVRLTIPAGRIEVVDEPSTVEPLNDAATPASAAGQET